MSRCHTVDALELYHHYAGAPLELSLSEKGTEAERIIWDRIWRRGSGPRGPVLGRLHSRVGL
ncbi:MAG: hypothetical protein P8J29_02785 [Rhodospirillales bacterium]|nr:hypothetical protein [Rhodospirillales bacterium]